MIEDVLISLDFDVTIGTLSGIECLEGALFSEFIELSGVLLILLLLLRRLPCFEKGDLKVKS